MKRLILSSIFLFSLALPGAGALAMQETSLAENILTTNLPDKEAEPATEPARALPEVSTADLSLFGVISLGIIGLFWIRRHTSEL